MGYYESLADRVRELVSGEEGLSERRMFGGLAFLVRGNLAVSASGQGCLLVRVEPGETGELLNEPHVHPFEMRGRTIEGWLRVGAEGIGTKRGLERWVTRGVEYARSLPPKG